MGSPKDATDVIIKQALEEEENEKKRRKSQKESKGQVAKKVKQGQTLGELEDEEAGPIKESMVSIAQSQRASKRKGGGVGDADLVQDVQRVEEDLEVEEEDGIKLEAFNLKEERERGYFDDEGNYVEREEKDEDEEADAWLQSDEAKVVDPKTLKAIQERQRQETEAEEAAPLTATQIARLQWQVAQLMKPGETVAGALRRLGGSTRNNRLTKRAKQAVAAAAAKEEPARDPADKARFDQLTEAASTLVDAGETDVYSRDRTFFERAASVYIDVDEGEEGGPSGGGMLAGGALAPSKTAYESADEDMFAEEGGTDKDKDKDGTAAAGGGTIGGGTTDAGEKKPSSSSGAKESAEDSTDYASWPIKELRRFLQEKGVDATGFVEKSELVAKVKQVAAASKTSTAVAGTSNAPPGYAFDPTSSMWWSSDSGMYWDPKSGGFFNPNDSKWYSYVDGAWVEWPAASEEK